MRFPLFNFHYYFLTINVKLNYYLLYYCYFCRNGGLRLEYCYQHFTKFLITFRTET